MPVAMVELWKLEGILFIVTVDPPTVLPVVLLPLPLTTIPAASAILIATPLAGCVLGKDISLAIASKPPNGSSCAAT